MDEEESPFHFPPMEGVLVNLSDDASDAIFLDTKIIVGLCFVVCP